MPAFHYEALDIIMCTCVNCIVMSIVLFIIVLSAYYYLKEL